MRFEASGTGERVSRDKRAGELLTGVLAARMFVFLPVSLLAVPGTVPLCLARGTDFERHGLGAGLGADGARWGGVFVGHGESLNYCLGERGDKSGGGD